jgi:putative phosphoribosyl transferase
MTHPFQDRSHAGRLLGQRLEAYANRADVIVLGLPRGGVPVAFEVARALKAPLDVFVVRKLGIPGQPEVAMGAIATGGIRVLNDVVVYELDIPKAAIDAVAREEERELRRREIAYRGHGESPAIAGKAVILVDDGIATGSTMRAAVRAIRHQQPARLIVAAPVAALATANEIRGEVDELVILFIPREFVAVGQWYGDFDQTSDEEVTTLLDAARQQHSSPATH